MKISDILIGAVMILVIGGFMAFIGFALFMGAGGALSGQEQFECNQWKQQATEYQGFYLTKWQKEQCDHYNITINAPVQ